MASNYTIVFFLLVSIRMRCEQYENCFVAFWILGMDKNLKMLGSDAVITQTRISNFLLSVVN